MLDLNKLEAEIDSFLANETKESYNDLFQRTDLIGLINKVTLSGGYTSDFNCLESVTVTKPNLIENDSDFFGQDLSLAA